MEVHYSKPTSKLYPDHPQPQIVPSRNIRKQPLFSLLHKWSEVKSLSHVRLFATPWTVAYDVAYHGIFKARKLEWVAISFSI